MRRLVSLEICLAIAATDTSQRVALAAYEYLITLKQEVALIWGRKWTGMTLLFVANRYIMVGWAVVQAAPYTPRVRLCDQSPARLFLIFALLFLDVSFIT